MKRVVSTRSLQGKYKMTEVSAPYCELIHNRQEKRETCFVIFLQNELKSDAARLSTHAQTCLAINPAYFRLREC